VRQRREQWCPPQPFHNSRVRVQRLECSRTAVLNNWASNR
jgi:hypothetical protein